MSVAHTPISFLKSGGADIFSARCVQALADAGYEPEDFGSYDYVAKRIAAAQRKCERWDEAQEYGETLPPEDEPTERDRWLARCQAGHLGQNACYQTERGNPCSNVLPGHDDGLYPCMPMEGSARVPGTEHNLWSIDEVDQPAARGLTPGSPYPESQMDADADKRTEKLVANRGSRPAVTTQRQDKGSGADEADAAPAEAAGEAGKASGDVSSSSAGALKKIDGETAAECINAFRRAGVAAMREHCKNSVEENEAIAGDEEYRANLAREREAARQRWKEAEEACEREPARSRLAGKKGWVTRAENELDAARRERPQNPERVRAAREDLRRRQEALETDPAYEERRRARGEYNRAAAAHNRAVHAHCMAQQGRSLRGEPPPPPPPPPPWADHDNGRTPHPWDVPRPGTHASNKTDHGL